MNKSIDVYTVTCCRNYEQTVTWQIEYCDSSLVIRQDSLVWYAIRYGHTSN